MLPRSQHAASFGRHPGMELVLVISAGLFVFGLVALMLAGGARFAGRRIPFAERIARFVVGAERAGTYPVELGGQGDWTVGETGPADRSEFAPVPERPKDDPRVPRRRRR